MLRLFIAVGGATLAAAAEPAMPFLPTALPALPPLETPPPPPALPMMTLPTMTLPPMPSLPTLPPLPSAEDTAKQAIDDAQKAAAQAASIFGQPAPAQPPPMVSAPTETGVPKSSSTVTDAAGLVKDAAAEGEKTVTDAAGLVKDATQEAQEDAAEAGEAVRGGAADAKSAAVGEDGEFDADGGPTREELKEKSQLEHMTGILYPAVKIVVSVRTFIIPVIALAVGGGMMYAAPSEAVAMAGKLVLYFGAQSFMNIFMSWVLHLKVTIYAGTEIVRPIAVTGSETTMDTFKLDTNLTGCPAGFALTAMQQVISFFLFVIFFVVMRLIGKPYTPKHLTSVFEWVSVGIFGCVFAANIALNNFSLAYISIGVNLIIRSCLPLTTYISQQALANFGLYKRKQCSPMHALEVLLMGFGVTCAAIFVWASFEGKLLANDKEGGGSSRLIGVVGCVASLLCGSVNLALAGVLGETKLNVLDTVAYMAVPATVFLMPIILFVYKPVPAAWAPLAGTIDGEVQRMTDWQVLAKTFEYSKPTIAWLVLSGFFSFLYNLVQFNIVHTLSPSATAFGGNFNKAALTFMTLVLPFLQTHALPKYPYILIEWIALIVNIMAFSGYSILTIMGKQQEAKKHEQLSESSEEEVESGSGSE